MSRKEEPEKPGQKRLLHVVASFSPAAGGTTEGIRRLAEASGEGAQVEVLSLDDPTEGFLAGHDFPVHGVGPVKSHYGYTSRLGEWIQKNLARFDGVAIHGLWQFHSYGTYRAVRQRVPYVVFPHGMLDPYFKRAYPAKHLKKQMYWLLREAQILRDANAVCFTSPVERDVSLHTFWPHRWKPVVVSFGTNAPTGDAEQERRAFFAQFPALEGRRFFLFLSRIHRKKGCDLLLEALGRLAGTHPDIDLVIAGPDEDRLRPELDAQSRRLLIADRVHWTGMLEGAAKWGAVRAAEAFVLPSHQENFGVAVVEAMACGTPVLISDKVNIWPDIARDEAGLVNPDTADGTYKGMATWLAMKPEERQRVSENGVKCFRARFEMKRTAAALQGLFQGSGPL